MTTKAGERHAQIVHYVINHPDGNFAKIVELFGEHKGVRNTETIIEVIDQAFELLRYYVRMERVEDAMVTEPRAETSDRHRSPPRRTSRRREVSIPDKKGGRRRSDHRQPDFFKDALWRQ